MTLAPSAVMLPVGGPCMPTAPGAGVSHPAAVLLETGPLAGARNVHAPGVAPFAYADGDGPPTSRPGSGELVHIPRASEPRSVPALGGGNPGADVVPGPTPSTGRRTYVRWAVQVERVRAHHCPRCDEPLYDRGDVSYCPCCERRFAWTETGWIEGRLTPIIGRCEHGA